MSTLIRPPAVAGLFYPRDPLQLRQEIQGMLSRASAEIPRLPPKALVVPHAGYIYSGPIAASAYVQLADLRTTVRRVVLLGPTHRVAVRGLALPTCAGFATPLGTVPLDKAAEARLASLPQVIHHDETHALEHAIEVQLPFLQEVLDDFTLLPLAVGAATSEEVAQVLDVLWGGPETLLVVSTDLSHYQAYALAQATDRMTCQNILRSTRCINHNEACGATPLNGLILAAQRHGLVPVLLDLRNSGDTAGDQSRVVGYAAFAFYPEFDHGQ